MARLRDQLVSFIAALRAAGVRISVAESIDAMNAVAAVGLERARMHEALAAALIKDEADRAIFDESFNRFFAAPRANRGEHPDQRGEQVSAAGGRGRPGGDPFALPRDAARASPRDEKSLSLPSEAKPAKQAAATRRNDAEKGKDAEGKDAERLSDRMRGRQERAVTDTRAESPTPGIDATRVARIRAIERTAFDKFSDLDYDEARDALAPLIRRFRIRLGRRLRLAQGGRIDFRRTIRAALQRGGALIDLNFRARRPRHVDLVILADISGSVRYAAQLMLELMAGARGCFRRVSSFVYVDHLAEADFEDGHLVMTPAAGPVRALGFRPRARRALGAPNRIADSRHDRRDHGRRPQQPTSRARRPAPRDRAGLPCRGVAESGRSCALGHGRQCDQTIRARSERARAVAKPPRASSRAGRNRLAGC